MNEYVCKKKNPFPFFFVECFPWSTVQVWEVTVHTDGPTDSQRGPGANHQGTVHQGWQGAAEAV